MSLASRVTALLLMFAWCFATGHLTVEHAGELAGHSEAGSGAIDHRHDGHHHHHHGHDDGEHRDEPSPPGEHHHHDLGVAARESGNALIKAPLIAVIFVTLLVPADASAEEPALPAVNGSPPDARRSGYLLVVQTARPVRGPSLVA